MGSPTILNSLYTDKKEDLRSDSNLNKIACNCNGTCKTSKS